MTEKYKMLRASISRKKFASSFIISHNHVNKYYHFKSRYLEFNKFDSFTRGQFVLPTTSLNGYNGCRSFHSSFNPMLYKITSPLNDNRKFKKVIVQKHYPCTEEGCDLEFVSQAGLDRHLPQHDLTRKYVCS